MSYPKLYILFFVILIFTVGCKEIIDYDEKSVKQAFVVAGVFEPGKPFDLRLSKTQNRFDTLGYTYLNDRLVKIYENGNFIGRLANLEDGRYMSISFVPNVNKTYRVEVLNGDKIETSAESYIPEARKIISIDTFATRIGGEKRLIVKLKFTDPGTEENFYRIEIAEELYVPYLTSKGEARIKVLRIFRPVELEANWLLRGMGFYSESDVFREWAENNLNIFSDRYIQGKQVELNLDVKYFPEDSVLGSNMKIYLQSLSRDYFYYLRTVQQQNSSFSNPFNEPVEIYTNINNGIGIFGGFSQNVDSVIHINRHLIDKYFPGVPLPFPLN